MITATIRRVLFPPSPVDAHCPKKDNCLKNVGHIIIYRRISATFSNEIVTLTLNSKVIAVVYDDLVQVTDVQSSDGLGPCPSF